MILRFFQFILLALALSLVTLLAAITTMHFATHGAEVTVPDFRNMDVAAATRKAAALNLAISVDEHFYSATTSAGHILTQQPAPGSIVRTEWSVRVTDSLGPQRVAVPRVTGVPERIATLEIRKLGFDLGTIARMPWTSVSPGMVVAQTPQPGAANVDRPNVSLLLETTQSAPTPAYIMPDLLNSTYASAASAIARAGLKLGPVDYRSMGVPATPAVDSAGIPQPPLPPTSAGIIVAQQPDAGMYIDANTIIALTVSQ